MKSFLIILNYLFGISNKVEINFGFMCHKFEL
jgi:hypothetical protein